MNGIDLKSKADPVQENQRDQRRDRPPACRVEGERTGQQKDPEVAEGLQPPQQIAAFVQVFQQVRADRAPVPIHRLRFAFRIHGGKVARAIAAGFQARIAIQNQTCRNR